MTSGTVQVMIAADETYPRTTIDLPDGGQVRTTTTKRYVVVQDGETVDRVDALAEADGDTVFDRQTNRFVRRPDGAPARRLAGWDPTAWGVNAR